MESKQIAPETTEAKEYISGQSRNHDDDHKVTHLYYGTFSDPGWPMCARGWKGLAIKLSKELDAQLSSMTEELRIARKNVEGLTHWWTEAKADLEGKNLEIAGLKKESDRYRKMLELILPLLPKTTKSKVATMLDKYKKEG